MGGGRFGCFRERRGCRGGSYQDTQSSEAAPVAAATPRKPRRFGWKVLSLWSLVIGVAVHFFLAAYWCGCVATLVSRKRSKAVSAAVHTSLRRPQAALLRGNFHCGRTKWQV